MEPALAQDSLIIEFEVSKMNDLEVVELRTTPTAGCQDQEHTCGSSTHSKGHDRVKYGARSQRTHGKVLTYDCHRFSLLNFQFLIPGDKKGTKLQGREVTVARVTIH